MMEMHISDPLHELRRAEIELTADRLMKKHEEKEAVREERERLREEARVAIELAAERERLDKEREHLKNAIVKLAAAGATHPALEDRIAAVDEAIAQNDYRAANIRAGYVYVISNSSAFGRPTQAGIERFSADWTQEQPEDSEAYLSREQCIKNATRTRDWGCSWDVWKTNPHLSGKLAHDPGTTTERTCDRRRSNPPAKFLIWAHTGGRLCRSALAQTA